MVDKKVLIAKIAASKNEVEAAEVRLTEALGGTRNAPRAEKTTVNESVQDAIAKLRVARTDLEDLIKLLSEDDS